MTQAIQLRPPDQLPDLADPLGVQGAMAAQTSTLARMHRLLRNRYKWCVLLALVLGAAGGVGGYFSRKPVYSCTGMIQIRPVVERILFPSEESRMLNYESFVNSQIALLRSQRVITLAMQSPDWKALGRQKSTPEEEIADFLERLTVTNIQRSEIITVSFEDTDRAATVAAVSGVLNAYNSIYIVGAGEAETQRMEALDRRAVSLASERNAKREAILQISREFGTDDLRPLLTARMQDLSKLESALNETNLLLASMGDVPAETKKETRPEEMTVHEIATVDPEMRRLLRELTDAEMETAVRRRDLGANHPRMIDALAWLNMKRKAVEEYAAAWRKRAAETPSPAVSDTRVVQRQQLEARKKQYEEMIAAAKREVLDVGRKMLEIEKLRREEEAAVAALEQTRKRIDELRTESQNQHRVRVISTGDRPLVVRDRRIQFAVAGSLAGVVGAVLIVLGIAAVDRRLRDVQDLRSSAGNMPLLGVLPSLPEDLADPEQAAIAAHCVHQIRALLQIGRGDDHGGVFTITSPDAGTGKTSLCLSLGVSFAACGSRTLMIDCDLGGGGLSARVDAIIRRKIGQIFRRRGAITQQQLETALKLAQNSQRKLGEILVELGYLQPSDVQEALALQQKAPVGLLDALNGDGLHDCVAETGIEGLRILPVGAARAGDASRLSPAAVRTLLAQARQHYDIVLIDTGPVPGSLEAAVMAAASDEVVLVVSRGDQRPAAQRSLEHLRDIGARVAGIVFNRAEARDLSVMGTTTTVSAEVRVTEVPPVVESPKFGPVALAVAKGEHASRREGDGSSAT